MEKAESGLERRKRYRLACLKAIWSLDYNAVPLYFCTLGFRNIMGSVKRKIIFWLNTEVFSMEILEQAVKEVSETGELSFSKIGRAHV